MSILKIPNIEISDLPKNQITLNQEYINRIDQILDKKGNTYIINLLQKLKLNWSKAYKESYWAIEKIDNLENIIINLRSLLNQLKIVRVYNNTVYIDNNTEEKLSNLESIENMLINDYKLNDNLNTIWASCNEWVIFIYKLLKDITKNDPEIDYEFQINHKDWHWILYINLLDKRYSFESSVKWLEFIEQKKTV